MRLLILLSLISLILVGIVHTKQVPSGRGLDRLFSGTWSFEAQSSVDPARWHVNGQFSIIDNDPRYGIVAKLEEKDGWTGKERYFVFQKDRLIQRMHVVVNGVEDWLPYTCAGAEEIPPLPELVDSIADATSLPSSNVQPSILAQCDSAPLFRIAFAGRSYIICLNREDKVLVFGSEFQATLTPSMTPLIVDSNEKAALMACRGYQKKLLMVDQFQVDAAHRDTWYLVPRPMALNKGTFTESGKKHCIFLHGSGESPAGPPTDSYPGYWGKMNTLLADQCSNFSYIHADTVTQGWNNKDLQAQYCELALTGQKGKFWIENKIIFTHSMGNLILAGAFNNSLCGKGNGTKWYSVAPPLIGSGVAKALHEICGYNGTGVWKQVARILGACDAEGRPTIAYQSLIPGNPAFDEIQAVALKNIDAQMCGKSAMGLGSIYSIPLEIIQSVAKLKGPNDGLVELFSCQLPDKDWYPYSEKPYYLTSLNHADLTCREGDGWWGTDRQPCNWYKTISQN